MLRNLESDVTVLQDIRRSAQRIEQHNQFRRDPATANDMGALALELERLCLRIMYLEEELDQHLEVLGEHLYDRSTDGISESGPQGNPRKGTRRSPVKALGVEAS